MKPKVSIASLLPLLSAITATRYQLNTPDSGSVSSESRGSSEVDMCEDYDNITRWTAKQLKINDHLRNFQATLGSIISSFDTTKSIEKCCFYKNNTVDLIIENVNIIVQESDSDDNPIERSKDLSTNLKNIFSKIKKTFVKGVNVCCENLREAIQKEKGEAEEKVKKISMEYKEKYTESSIRKDGLQKKVKHLEGQIAAAKSRLEKLQNEVGKSNEKTNCCEELKQQFSVLDSQISTAKTEADNEIKNLDNQLKDIKEKLWNQDKITEAIKKTIDDGGEITKNTIDKSKNNCGNPNSSQDKQIQKDDLPNLKAKIDSLQMLLVNLTNKISNLDIQGSSKSLSVTLNTCLENYKKLYTIESELQEKIRQQNQTCSQASPEMTKNESSTSNQSCSSDEQLKERIKALQNESKILDDERQKFPSCCQKIDKLQLQAEQLTNVLQIMNKTYHDQIQENTKKFKALKDALDEFLNRQGEVNHPRITNAAQEQVKKLEKKLNKASINLEALKETQDDFVKLMENANHLKYSPNEFAKLRKDFEEFRIKILRQLMDYERKKLPDPSAAARQRESRLKQIKDDMDKLKNTIQLLEELHRKAQDELEKRKTPSKLMLDCEEKCKEMEKFGTLTDQIEDAKKLLKTKATTTTKATPKATAKPIPKPTQKLTKKVVPKYKPTRKVSRKEKPKRKWSGVLVGGIHFEPERLKLPLWSD